MAATVWIQPDPAQEARLREELAGVTRGVERVQTVAVNRTLTTGRSRISKRLAGIINLKAGSASDPQPGTISSFLRVKKATWDKPEGAVTLTRSGIPLTRFDPKPNAPGPADVEGVNVKTRKGRGRETLKHTFVARMKSGHVGVFERVRGKGKDGKRSRRLPLQERYGPTPLGVFEGAPGIAAEILLGLGDVLQKNMDSQADRVLDRAKAARPETAEDES